MRSETLLSLIAWSSSLCECVLLGWETGAEEVATWASPSLFCPSRARVPRGLSRPFRPLITLRAPSACSLVSGSALTHREYRRNLSLGGRGTAGAAGGGAAGASFVAAAAPASPPPPPLPPSLLMVVALCGPPRPLAGRPLSTGGGKRETERLGFSRPRP